MCKSNSRVSLRFPLVHITTVRTKGNDLFSNPGASSCFPAVIQTAWRSACSPPMRSTSVTSLCRSTSPSSRRSASTTTSTWCESTTSRAWQTSWAPTAPASPRTRTAFLSRYVPGSRRTPPPPPHTHKQRESLTGLAAGDSCTHHSSVWVFCAHAARFTSCLHSWMSGWGVVWLQNSSSPSLCFSFQSPSANPWKDPALDKLGHFCEESRSAYDWVPTITLPERWSNIPLTCFTWWCR